MKSGRRKIGWTDIGRGRRKEGEWIRREKVNRNRDKKKIRKQG